MVKIYDFEKEFIDFGIGLYCDFGLDLLTAKLFMMLYMEPCEISMDELAEITGYSLASVSGKMRALEAIGVAKRIKKPGTKKVFYYVDKDVVEMQRRKVNIAFQKYIIPAKKRLPELLNKYKNVKLDEKGRKKMEIINNYYQQIRKLETLFKGFIKHLSKL